MYKVLAEKTTEHDRQYDATKVLQQSNHSLEKVKKPEKMQRSIESLILKVMAHKICEMISQPSTIQPEPVIQSRTNENFNEISEL